MMPFTLPPLPFEREALQPFMSAETLDFHHGKHHKAYVEKTNQLCEEGGLAGRSLAEVIAESKGSGHSALFNNSAQLWNHSFFWLCLAPNRGQQPTGLLAQRIEDEFGSAEQLLAQMKSEAVGHFSNGWAWLVLESDRLKVISLHDADTPVVHDGVKPLLTLDLWEHAYYVDYRNRRPDFVDALLANLINWEFVGTNLDGEGISRANQHP